MHILDIANNSTRALAKTVTLEVTADFVRDVLTVAITDDGHGMDEELLKRLSDPFATTRTTRRVGMGIPLYRMAAENSGGSLQIESKLGKGTRVTATFKISHIDRPPLGDMAETVITMIGGAPETDFTFIYRTDAGAYEFCTKAVKDALGEDDLSDVTVLLYLKDLIDENVKNLNGGNHI